MMKKFVDYFKQLNEADPNIETPTAPDTASSTTPAPVPAEPQTNEQKPAETDEKTAAKEKKEKENQSNAKYSIEKDW